MTWARRCYVRYIGFVFIARNLTAAEAASLDTNLGAKCGRVL